MSCRFLSQTPQPFRPLEPSDALGRLTAQLGIVIQAGYVARAKRLARREGVPVENLFDCDAGTTFDGMDRRRPTPGPAPSCPPPPLPPSVIPMTREALALHVQVTYVSTVEPDLTERVQSWLDAVCDDGSRNWAPDHSDLDDRPGSAWPGSGPGHLQHNPFLLNQLELEWCESLWGLDEIEFGESRPTTNHRVSVTT